MPYIILPDRWREQPQYPVDLDRNHPLAQDLVSAPLFSQGVLHDPGFTSPWTNSGLTFSASDYGLSAYGTGSSHAENASPISAYAFSGAVLYKLANLTDFIRLIGLGSAGNGRIIFFSDGVTANDPIALNRKDKTTNNQTTDRVNGQLSDWNFASFSVNSATSSRVSLNRTSTSFSTTAYDVGPETFTHASIGRFYNSIDYRLNGFAAFWALWSRAISFDEHLALLENPWQIYRRDLGAVYFIPAAGGPQTVAPTIGHISFTGRTPAITQPRALGPTIGHAVITGRVPTVLQGVSRTLYPEIGHAAITGYTPAITQPRALGPSIGHAVITGRVPAVVQEAGQRITAAIGHISFSGYAPSITQPRALAPSIGHVAITGRAPTIKIAPPGMGMILASRIITVTPKRRMRTILWPT